MKSATKLLLNNVSKEIWLRGEDYADSNKVEILTSNDSEIKAVVKGTQSYNVELKFAGSEIVLTCSCPYKKGVCKHIVATAILWDESRGIARPSKEKTESQPQIGTSKKQFLSVFNDPLNANLEDLRCFAEKRGMWSRPHSHLPEMPKFNTDISEPLRLTEIKSAFKEMERWSRRAKYDPYFCAGEMIAAFCEVLRIIKKRLSVTAPMVAVDSLLEAQKFHYDLLQRLIDDSDGYWQINEAHLEDIYETLRNMSDSNVKRASIDKKLEEYVSQQGKY